MSTFLDDSLEFLRTLLAEFQSGIAKAHPHADGGAHLLGTCRTGHDPQISVVDKYHRTHDIRNLLLCDASSMVTVDRGQPTLTTRAMAFRAAEPIAAAAARNNAIWGTT